MFRLFFETYNNILINKDRVNMELKGKKILFL